MEIKEEKEIPKKRIKSLDEELEELEKPLGVIETKKPEEIVSTKIRASNILDDTGKIAGNTSIYFGTEDTIAATNIGFLGAAGSVITGTELEKVFLINKEGTISNMYVSAAANGVGADTTIVCRKNLSDKITVTLASGVTSGNNTITTFIIWQTNKN